MFRSLRGESSDAMQPLKKSYDLECDLWSMGVILYILLSGYPPFYGDTDGEIYTAIHKGVPSNFGSKVESWLANSVGEDRLPCVNPSDEFEWAEFDFVGLLSVSVSILP